MLYSLGHRSKSPPFVLDYNTPLKTLKMAKILLCEGIKSAACAEGEQESLRFSTNQSTNKFRNLGERGLFVGGRTRRWAHLVNTKSRAMQCRASKMNNVRQQGLNPR
jgi:hypothetical protein